MFKYNVNRVLCMYILTYEEYKNEINKYYSKFYDDRLFTVHRIYFVLRIPVETGITPSELACLEKENIKEHDYNGVKYATLEILKGSKKIRHGGILKKVKRKLRVIGADYRPRYRTVLINSDLWKELKQYNTIFKSDYIIPRLTSNGSPTNSHVTSRALQKVHRYATNKWNMHEVKDGRLGARHMFKHYVKFKSMPMGYYDEDELRKLMGHRPIDAHGMYDPFINLDWCIQMIESAFGYINKRSSDRSQLSIDNYV